MNGNFCATDERGGIRFKVRRAIDNLEADFYLQKDSNGAALLELFSKGGTLYLVDSPIAAEQSIIKIDKKEL